MRTTLLWVAALVDEAKPVTMEPVGATGAAVAEDVAEGAETSKLALLPIAEVV